MTWPCKILWNPQNKQKNPTRTSKFSKVIEYKFNTHTKDLVKSSILAKNNPPQIKKKIHSQ